MLVCALPWDHFCGSISVNDDVKRRCREVSGKVWKHTLLSFSPTSIIWPQCWWKLAEGLMTSCHEMRRAGAAWQHFENYLLLGNYTEAGCDSSLSRQPNCECCQIYYDDTKIFLGIYETLPLDLLIPSAGADCRLAILSQLTSVPFNAR